MSVKFYNGCLIGFEIRDYSIMSREGEVVEDNAGVAILIYIPFVRLNILW
jgi:hypothetical protein